MKQAPSMSIAQSIKYNLQCAIKFVKNRKAIFDKFNCTFLSKKVFATTVKRPYPRLRGDDKGES
jgi:hypothetical protein